MINIEKIILEMNEKGKSVDEIQSFLKEKHQIFLIESAIQFTILKNREEIENEKEKERKKKNMFGCYINPACPNLCKSDLNKELNPTTKIKEFGRFWLFECLKCHARFIKYFEGIYFTLAVFRDITKEELEKDDQLNNLFIVKNKNKEERKDEK